MPQAESAIQPQDVSLQQIEEQLAALKSRIDVLDKKVTEPKVAAIVFSGDLEKNLPYFLHVTAVCYAYPDNCATADISQHEVGYLV